MTAGPAHRPFTQSQLGEAKEFKPNMKWPFTLFKKIT